MNDVHNVRSALVVAVGTSAGGIVQVLRWLLAGLRGVERLGVLHVDSDGTRSFAHMPTQLFSGKGPDDWGANAFVHTPPPTDDLVRSIQRGERHGYPLVPPAIFDAVNGDGVGVGGLVPLGNLAGVLHESNVRGAVRRAINRITAHSSETNDENDAPLMVFEISGCLGGTWGELEPVHDVIVSEAQRMATRVAFQRTVLFPGQHPTKDMDGSMCNAASWLQEFAARASARYLFLLRSNNGHPPKIDEAQASPTWIVSDMNAAGGKSSTLATTSALFTIVGWWHALWLATPLGPRLEQALVDFRDDALDVDARGERRFGRSFGMSFITIDHDRIAGFASNRLVRASLEALLAPIEPQQVEGDARRFNRANRLHEGAGLTDISTAIRTNNAAGRPVVDHVSRFRYLLDENIAGLDGICLLRDAPGIIDTTVAQTSDAANHFRAAREAKVTHVERAIDERIQRSLWETNLGASYVQAWLGEQKRFFEQMVDLAADDKLQRAKHIEQLQNSSRRIEEDAIPQFLGMGALRRWFNHGQIQILADRYARDRRALEIARKEDQARAEAIAALQAIAEIFEVRHAAVTELVEELARTADAAAAEAERIRQWDGTLHNPIGFELHDDLEGCYLRVLDRPGDEESANQDVERRAVLNLLVELRQECNLMALAPESGKIARVFDTIARRRVRPRVAALHVQDELFERHAPGSDRLQSFLRERDREAHERVTFNGTTEHDNPVHVLRFLLADPRRGPEIVSALNDAACTRAQAQGNVDYELIPTPDAERITLVQVRVSFPTSQVGLYPACAAAYDNMAQTRKFERSHTELVGRFLPRPNQPATPLDAQVALVKGYALSAGPLPDRPAPLELVSTSDAIILHRWKGENEVVGTDIGNEHHIARRYDVRVEMATRFFATWQLQGPDPLRQRAVAVRSHLSGSTPTRDPLAEGLAPLVSQEAVNAVLAELDWYGRNTDPAACLWSGSAG